MRTLTIGHNRLYTFGSEVSSITPGFLTAFPLDNISPTTPNSTIFNTTALTAPSSPYNACYHSSTPIVYTNHGALTILCGGKVRSLKTLENLIFKYCHFNATLLV
jgi:hypothetical protein